jgi:hypothetical protein
VYEHFIVVIPAKNGFNKNYFFSKRNIQKNLVKKQKGKYFSLQQYTTVTSNIFKTKQEIIIQLLFSFIKFYLAINLRAYVCFNEAYIDF